MACFFSFFQDKIGGFLCNCESGYEGTLCNTDIDDCVGNLCTEQGTCVVSVYMCLAWVCVE